MMNNKWIYFGVFLNNESKQLLTKIKEQYTDNTWTTYCHHMTIAFNNHTEEAQEKYLQYLPLFGTPATLKATHIGISDEATAVKVEFNGTTLTNLPHITLATKQGVKPVRSNYITHWTKLEQPIILHGTFEQFVKQDMKPNIDTLVKESLRKALYEHRSTKKTLSKPLQNMIFISYGTTYYDKNKVKPVDVNSLWGSCHNKPHGGLWASPLNSKYGWVDFCDKEGVQLKTLDKHFLFQLTNDAKIYIINDETDLQFISTSTNQYGKKHINFASLVKNYDGMFITYKAANELRFCKIDIEGLSSWDVESLCVWNPNVIQEVSENAFDYAKIPLRTTSPWEDENYDDTKGRKYLQMQNDYMKYGNQNINKDMASYFNGEHPAILSQMHGNNKQTKLARKFDGTIKSGIQ